MTAHKGFTLIELMIVTAIISILAAIAIPAYQNYVTRAQVTEGVSLATSAKVAIATYYADTGKYPENNTVAGLANPSSIKGRYVDSLVVDDTGLIAVTFSSMANENIRGETLTLSAANHSGSLSWTCGGMSTQYLPSSCR